MYFDCTNENKMQEMNTVIEETSHLLRNSAIEISMDCSVNDEICDYGFMDPCINMN